MSTPRYIADLHMEHKSIHKYRPVFESSLHNDLYCMAILEETCTKRDTLWCLGDCLFGKKYIPFFKSLPGNKFLVLGNHDTREGPGARELLNGFDEVYALVKHKNVWLSHAPLHPDELRGKYNVHGHVHDASIPDPRYLNVSMDSTFSKYFPRSLHEVRVALEEQNKNGTYHAGIDAATALDVLKECPVRARIYDATLKASRTTTVYVP